MCRAAHGEGSTGPANIDFRFVGQLQLPTRTSHSYIRALRLSPQAQAQRVIAVRRRGTQLSRTAECSALSMGSVVLNKFTLLSTYLNGNVGRTSARHTCRPCWPPPVPRVHHRPSDTTLAARQEPSKAAISSQCQCHRYALHHLRPHASDMHIISECTVPATSSIDGVKQWMLHAVRVGRDSPQPTPCPAAALPCCSDLAHRQAGLVRVVRHRGVRNRRRRARRPRCGPRCGRLLGLGRVVIVQRFEHRGRGLVEHRA